MNGAQFATTKVQLHHSIRPVDEKIEAGIKGVGKYVLTDFEKRRNGSLSRWEGGGKTEVNILRNKKREDDLPNYKNEGEIKKLADRYFSECDGEYYFDEEGLPLRTQRGEAIYKVQPKPYTVTGLALALGFTKRQSLLDYPKDGEFANIIAWAKSRVEEYTEVKLIESGSAGAKFSLANNFKNWREKQDVDLNGGMNITLNGAEKYGK